MIDAVDSFVCPETGVAGIELRPFTAGSYLLCQRRGLSMFTGESGELNQAAQLFQVMAFLFIHSAPMNEVLIACGNEDYFQKSVDEFALNVPMAAIPQAMKLIRDLCEQVAASTIETIAKPSSGNGETPPPNSSGRPRSRR